MMEKQERNCFIFIIVVLTICLVVSLFATSQVNKHPQINDIFDPYIIDDEDIGSKYGALIFTITTADSIIFGDNIGKLSWENGIFEFEGDVGKSAELFFQYVKFWIEDYIKKGDD